MSIASKLYDISLCKQAIKTAIENKLNTSISQNFSQYPSYILSIKNLTGGTVPAYTGNSVGDKARYMDIIKDSINNAIRQCGVTDFNANNLIEYSSAITRITTIEPGDHSLTIDGPSVITGESCTFTAMYDVENNVTSSATWSIISGSSYGTMSNGTLTIGSSANNSNVTISATYMGINATKNVTLWYKSGSSAETTVETDESGNTTVTVDTTNSDGSSSSIATHYDSDGNETGHESTNVDTSGNSSTQTVVKDEQGNDIVTGYEIDTGGNPNGGMEITGGVDTGVLVFDGHD